MRTLPLALLAMLAVATAPALARESFDYYFVIDCSGSMAGRPAGSGNANIMPRVKEAVSEFLEKVSPGSRVAILPFDARVHDSKWISLARAEDRGALQRFVNGLDPKGPRTCIYPALNQAFDWFEAARARAGKVQCLSTFLLYTDGLNDCDDPARLEDVLERFRRIRGPNDHLFYTTLGVHLPAAEQALLENTPGVRYVAEPRGQLEPISVVEVRPSAVDFGEVAATGKATRRLLLSFNEHHLRGQTVKVSAQVPDLSDKEAVRVLPETFALEGNEVALTLELVPREAFRQREYEGSLRLVSETGRIHLAPGTLALSFSTLPPRSWKVTSPSSIPIALGELAFSPEGRARARVKFLLEPSASVAAAGCPLTVEVAPDPANPRSLDTKRQLVVADAASKGGKLSLAPGAREFTLELDLSRSDCAPGQYRGDLLLSCEGASVSGHGLVAIPGTEKVRKVPFWFVLPGERVAVVSVPSGLPLELGTAVLERIGEGQPAILEKPVMVSFSPDAESHGARFRADLSLASDNPTALDPAKDLELTSGEGRGPSVTVEPRAGRFTLKALVPRTARAGVYRGQVTLWPQNVSLGGTGLENSTQSETARVLPFRFTVEPDSRLALKAAGWAPDLGDVQPGATGQKLEYRLSLDWSPTAVKNGATAQAKLTWDGKAALGILKSGVQSGDRVRLTPQESTLVLALDPMAGPGIGRHRATLEVRGEGCTVVGEGFTAAAGAAPTMKVSFRVPRPLWLDLSVAAVVLLLVGTWLYAASLARFSALARLSMEEGPGALGSYYLRGHQGRFSTRVAVGSKGAAELAFDGLIGRSFEIQAERGGRCSLVAIAPVTLRLSDGTEQTVAPGRRTPLHDGTLLLVGELKLLFNNVT